jgi:hypothetical protein
MRCLSLIGLKQILGNRVIDVPKIPHIYKDYSGNVLSIYGKGFSYSKILDPDDANRNSIIQRIENREFELVIYGSLHRGLPLLKTVQNCYSAEEIVYLCGEDDHQCIIMPPRSHFFLREFSCLKSLDPPEVILPTDSF